VTQFIIHDSRLTSASLRVLCGCLLLFQFLSGCATYAERTLKLHNAYYDNQLDVAKSTADSQLKYEWTSADLVRLDQAMIDLGGGRRESSGAKVARGSRSF